MSPVVPRILVIDDELELLNVLRRQLQTMGFEADVAASGPEGIARYSEDAFDAVLVDLKMPGMDGIEVIRRLKAQDENALAVVMTGYGSVESAVEAMKAGATDYLTKPLDMDHLEIVLKRALEDRRQAERLRLLEAQLVKQGSFEGMVGVSAGMQRVYEMVRRLAGSDATVLIQGETGTGKELVARAIHNRSPRCGRAFVPINCAALPETLLESELFGHEKGAFTGAVRRKYGLIEQAEGGTLLLDEIEEMSPALQVKLLRAIQEREVLRVGGEAPIPVDFRLVAATSADLAARMEAGAFRPDLYYRLSVTVIDLPPLRARASDIPLLAKHFSRIYAEKSNRPTPEIAPEAVMLLNGYRWPGNVRELENVIEQAVLLCTGETITEADLPASLAGTLSSTGAPEDPCSLPLRQARERFERQYLEEMFNRTEGNVAEAARHAGINRQHFYEKMKRYGAGGKQTKNEE